MKFDEIAVSAGLEPATSGLGNLRSIQLNYETESLATYGVTGRSQDTVFSSFRKSYRPACNAEMCSYLSGAECSDARVEFFF